MWETKDGEAVWVQHTLPDLVLVSAAAGKLIRAVIIDGTTRWCNLKGAKESKERSYAPLRDMMIAHLGDKCDRVDIVTIAFTARGTPPEDWNQICEMLKIKIPAQVLLKRIQRAMLTSMDQIMTQWMRQSYAHAMQQR